MSIHPSTRHCVKLATHPSSFGIDAEPLQWGARDPRTRGAVVATVSRPGRRNAIGAHSGTYSVYRAVALAVQAGEHRQLRVSRCSAFSPLADYELTG